MNSAIEEWELLCREEPSSVLAGVNLLTIDEFAQKRQFYETFMIRLNTDGAWVLSETNSNDCTPWFEGSDSKMNVGKWNLEKRN